MREYTRFRLVTDSFEIDSVEFDVAQLFGKDIIISGTSDGNKLVRRWHHVCDATSSSYIIIILPIRYSILLFLFRFFHPHGPSSRIPTHTRRTYGYVKNNILHQQIIYFSPKTTQLRINRR